MKYFKVPYTAVNLQKQFRTLSKKLHPDIEGGDYHKFVEMQNQYRDLLYIVDNGDILLSKCQSEYFKKKYGKEKPRVKKDYDWRKHGTRYDIFDNVEIKEILKQALKNRKKVSYKRGNVVYILNVNEFLNTVIDKLF